MKTIKKAYVSLEDNFESVVRDTRKFIKKLHDDKKEIVSGINNSKNMIDSLKRDIEKSFNQVRDVLRTKEQEMMRYLDHKMKDILDHLNGNKKKLIQAKLNEQ